MNNGEHILQRVTGIPLSHITYNIATLTPSDCLMAQRVSAWETWKRCKGIDSATTKETIEFKRFWFNLHESELAFENDAPKSMNDVIKLLHACKNHREFLQCVRDTKGLCMRNDNNWYWLEFDGVEVLKSAKERFTNSTEMYDLMDMSGILTP